MKINFSKDILPHLLAFLIFYILTTMYFGPIVFGDKEISQHDITQWEGASKELRDYRKKTGEEGLWANSMFSGMPAYLVNTEYSDKVIVYTKIIASLGLPHPVRNIFLAFLSFYILLLVFRVNPYLAIGGAIAYGMSSYLIIGIMAGHNSRIGAIAFVPLVIAGIHYAYSYRYKLGGAALMALGLSLHLRENHLQITYYLLIITIIYGLVQLFYFIKRNEQKEFFIRTGLLSIGALIALGTFMGRFLTTLEYSKYSIRGQTELSETLTDNSSKDGLSKSYAFEYSNGIMEPLTLFIPNAFGGSSSNILIQDDESNTYRALVNSGDNQTAQQLARYSSSYWGSQRLSAPYYAGAITVMLFILGLLLAPRRYVVWTSIVALLGVMLTWGSNFSSFNYFMFDYFPGYNKFRSVTFAILLPLFSMPLLGFIGLQKLTEGVKRDKSLQKKFLISAGIAAGICLLALVGSTMVTFLKEGEGQLPRWFTNALQADRRSLLRMDALRSLLFVILASGALIFHYKNVINLRVTGVIIALLMIIDLFSVDRRYLNSEMFKTSKASTVTATDADREILKDRDPGYRVYNLAASAWNESTTSYFHESIGGYHGAKLRRYQELIEYCINDESSVMIEGLQNGTAEFSKYNVLNMLNVRYLKYGPGADNIIRNPSANGAAWVVNKVQSVSSPDEELSATCDLNTKEEAVVDTEKFEIPEITKFGSGTIKLVRKDPGLLEYDVSVTDNSMVIFSEIYYPKGWKAYSGNDEIDIIRVNYVLRGALLDSSVKKLTFKFEPNSYKIGNTITAISSVLLLLVIAGSILQAVRSER